MQAVAVVRPVIRVRRAVVGGRPFLIAPVVLLVPGVLNNGSGEPTTLYTAEEIIRTARLWNRVPITLGHHYPRGVGFRTADSAAIMGAFGLGFVDNVKADARGVLSGEAWFDLDRTQSVSPRLLDALREGRTLEVSTGLDETPLPAPEGAVFRGVPYDTIATNVRPDHLAVLLDGVGACSNADGAGILNRQGVPGYEDSQQQASTDTEAEAATDRTVDAGG